MTGHDKMRSGVERGADRHLVSFNYVIDPHFVTFSSSLYTTICNPNLNPNPNHNTNPNRNPTVITHPQIGPRDTQIVTVHPLRISSRVINDRSYCQMQFYLRNQIM